MLKFSFCEVISRKTSLNFSLTYLVYCFPFLSVRPTNCVFNYQHFHSSSSFRPKGSQKCLFLLLIEILLHYVTCIVKIQFTSSSVYVVIVIAQFYHYAFRLIIFFFRKRNNLVSDGKNWNRTNVSANQRSLKKVMFEEFRLSGFQMLISYSICLSITFIKQRRILRSD